MKRIFKWTAVILLPLMILVGTPAPHAWAQDPGSGLESRSSGSDDDITEGILIGLFAVVIGVLVWLGIQSQREDRNPSGFSYSSALPPGEEGMTNEDLWWEPAPELSEEEFRQVDRRTKHIGLRFEF